MLILELGFFLLVPLSKRFLHTYCVQAPGTFLYLAPFIGRHDLWLNPQAQFYLK